MVSTPCADSAAPTIRLYRPDDRACLCDLAVGVFAEASLDCAVEREFGPLNGTDWRGRKHEDIADDLDGNPTGCFVAELDGHVVGFITTVVDAATSVGRIPNLAVASGHQGRGIGRLLMDAALNHFETLGLLYSQIETLATNERGLQFYPSLGYREVARKVYYVMDLADRRKR